MMQRDVQHDHNEPNGAMAAMLAPLLAIVALGGAVAIVEPSRGIRATRAQAAVAPAVRIEIDAQGYEGLRDLLPGDPALARRTLDALSGDGRIDEIEFDALIADRSGRSRTAMDVTTAREDLARTARAYAGGAA